MDKAKYEEMLMKLAAEYPELETEVMDLNASLLDLDAPDVGAEDQEAEDDGELSLEIEAPKKAPGKEEIPPELLDMLAPEEDEDDEEEDMVPMTRKK